MLTNLHLSLSEKRKVLLTNFHLSRIHQTRLVSELLMSFRRLVQSLSK